MKKLLFAFLAIFLMLNSSCSRDDDSSSNFTSNSIIGKWGVVSSTFNGTAKNTSTGQTVTPVSYTHLDVYKRQVL